MSVEETYDEHMFDNHLLTIPSGAGLARALAVVEVAIGAAPARRCGRNLAT